MNINYKLSNSTLHDEKSKAQKKKQKQKQNLKKKNPFNKNTLHAVP